jgi:hypothetical protein
MWGTVVNVLQISPIVGRFASYATEGGWAALDKSGIKIERSLTGRSRLARFTAYRERALP